MNLALAIHQGIGVPKDDAEALRFYRLAADGGTNDFDIIVPAFLRLLPPTPPSPCPATRSVLRCPMFRPLIGALSTVWCPKWGVSGIVVAQFNLGCSYRDGTLGLDRNPAEALRLLSLAGVQWRRHQFSPCLCPPHARVRNPMTHPKGAARHSVLTVRPRRCCAGIWASGERTSERALQRRSLDSERRQWGSSGTPTSTIH